MLGHPQLTSLLFKIETWPAKRERLIVVFTFLLFFIRRSIYIHPLLDNIIRTTRFTVTGKILLYVLYCGDIKLVLCWPCRVFHLIFFYAVTRN